MMVAIESGMSNDVKLVSQDKDGFGRVWRSTFVAIMPAADAVDHMGPMCHPPLTAHLEFSVYHDGTDWIGDVPLAMYGGTVSPNAFPDLFRSYSSRTMWLSAKCKDIIRVLTSDTQ